MWISIVRFVLKLIDIDLAFNGETLYVTLKLGDKILIERTIRLVPHMRKDVKISAKGEL